MDRKPSFLNSIYTVVLSIWFGIYYVFIKFCTSGISSNSACLIGKTAIVTGGNSGIGFRVAKLLASRGCTVIIADKDDAEKSKQIIIEDTGNLNIIVKHLDLASFASVRKFAKDINATVDRLDILINNAGISGAFPKETEDGLDVTMQVNHFGPFLLTHLLVGLLKKSAPSRIIFATSTGAFNHHHLITEKLQTIDKESEDDAIKSLKRYYNSKFCIIVTADGFSKELLGTGVTVNCADPGVVKTDIVQTLQKNFPSAIQTIVIRLTMALLGKSPFVGAQTAFHLAASKKLEKVTGKCFNNCKLFIKPNAARQPELCDKIWQISEECVRLKPDEKFSGHIKK